MKKIISLITVLCMAFSMFTVSAFASTQEANVSVYENESLGGKLVRTVQSDGTIISEWIGNDGETATGILYPDGRLYVDGKLIANLSMEQGPLNYDVLSLEILINADDITWGKWNNFSEKIHTGGLTGAALLATIGVMFPELIPYLHDIVKIMMTYDYIEVRGRIRYGSDSTFSYFQRYTNVYGDGTVKLIPVDVYNEGRERL